MGKKDDVIKEFMKIKGVGKAKAEALYVNGFDSLDKLKKASVEDLTKISGINEALAKGIKKELKEEKTEETTVVESVEETKEEGKKVEKEEVVSKKEEKEKVEEKEGEEEKYKVKKKPELPVELKDKLFKRRQIKKRTPEFLREEWFRYKRIPKNWRRPDGITSKMRVNKKYRPSKVRVGFRGPREVRGFHPSGFEEVIVYNVNDLEGVNPKTQAVRIGGTVGTKKRLDIKKKAEELDVRILNI